MNPSASARCPSWNTHTSAPNVAPSEIVFISSALTGTSSEPVIRNSSTNSATATTPNAHGSRSASDPEKSTRTAASPVTQLRYGGRCSRSTCTSRCAASPWDEPVGVMSTDAYGELPSRVAGATAATSAVSTGRRPATYASSCSGVARASTVTGSVPAPGKRTCRFCCSWTLSNESGSRLAPPFSSVSESSGVPATSSTAATPSATSQARRCTARASVEKNPSVGASARRTGIRPPTSASSAGTRVSAASSATTTTAAPAAPMARNVGYVEDHQGGQRDRDGQCRERDRAPGSGRGPLDRAGHVRARGPLLRNRLTISSA